jgi:hypothetical protein
MLPTDSPAWVKIVLVYFPKLICIQPTIGLPPPHPQSSYEDACSMTGLKHSRCHSRDILWERAKLMFQLVMNNEDRELCLGTLAFVFG